MSLKDGRGKADLGPCMSGPHLVLVVGRDLLFFCVQGGVLTRLCTHPFSPTQPIMARVFTIAEHEGVQVLFVAWIFLVSAC